MFVRRSQGERPLEARTAPTIKHGGGHVRDWASFGNNKPGTTDEDEEDNRKTQ